MMRAYTIVGGTAGGEQPPLPTANPTTALQPTTTVSGIIYSESNVSVEALPLPCHRPSLKASAQRLN